MLSDIIPAAVTTLGIVYLWANFAVCSLLTLDRESDRDLRKAFTLNGTAAVCVIAAGSLMTILQN